MTDPVQVYEGNGKCPFCKGSGIILNDEMRATKCKCPAGKKVKTGRASTQSFFVLDLLAESHELHHNAGEVIKAGGNATHWHELILVAPTQDTIKRLESIRQVNHIDLVKVNGRAIEKNMIIQDLEFIVADAGVEKPQLKIEMTRSNWKPSKVGPEHPMADHDDDYMQDRTP